MKKVYSKPEIMFESFTLSQAIAGNCDSQTSLQTDGVCGMEWGDEVIFLTGISGCDTQYDTDDGLSGTCYHNPTDTNNLFNS